MQETSPPKPRKTQSFTHFNTAKTYLDPNIGALPPLHARTLCSESNKLQSTANDPEATVYTPLQVWEPSTISPE